MMLSSTFEEHSETKPKYPYFGKAIGLGYIVLFSKPSSGTVLSIVPERPTYRIGYYQEEWIENSFEPVRGILSIEAN